MMDVTAARRLTRGALLRAAAGLAGGVLAACALPGGEGGAPPAKVEGVVEIVSTGEVDPATPAWQARVAAIGAKHPGLTIQA